jgi:hypothetical protein
MVRCEPRSGEPRTMAHRDGGAERIALPHPSRLGAFRASRLRMTKCSERLDQVVGAADFGLAGFHLDIERLHHAVVDEHCVTP